MINFLDIDFLYNFKDTANNSNREFICDGYHIFPFNFTLPTRYFLISSYLKYLNASLI